MNIKYRILSLIILFISGTATLAQTNQNPIVENVTFSQREDGSHKVDIYYDVNDPDGNAMEVSMEVSNDGGQTWNLSAELVTGEIGEGITSGTGKHIVWDFGSEHPEYFSDQIQIKIIADDGISAPGEPCPGIPTVTYAGKTYNTVKIGNQCWLKENLDVGTMIESHDWDDKQTDNGTIEKYCYDNDPANCETYGGLYQWNEAMQYSTVEGSQGICPDGWHIPTLAEFEELEAFANDEAKKLLAVGQSSSATNETGFSALLAGYRFYLTGSFSNRGSRADFWSSAEYSNSYAHSMVLNYYSSNIHFLSFNYKSNGFSVRCAQD